MVGLDPVWSRKNGAKTAKLTSFLEQDTDGFIYVTGHRIGRQHLIHYYNEGFSPEMLACEYPSLSLAVGGLVASHAVVGTRFLGGAAGCRAGTPPRAVGDRSP